MEDGEQSIEIKVQKPQNRVIDSPKNTNENSKTFLLNDTTVMEQESEWDNEGEGEIVPNKNNYVFGMHPISPDNVVIDPNYPPQFFPYLYPHLYPHLFPHLYPHYAKEYKRLLKKKKEKKEKRPITVVLPDGRNVVMTKKEFLSYQLALAQMGYENGRINKLAKREDDDSIDELEILDHFREKQDGKEKGRDGIAGNPPTKKPSMNASSTVLKDTGPQKTPVASQPVLGSKGGSSKGGLSGPAKTPSQKPSSKGSGKEY